MREMQGELTRVEFKQQADPPVAIEIRDVDLNDLLLVAADRYDLSQFFAARTFVAMLSDAQTLPKAASALAKEKDVPRVLAFLCTSDNVEVCKAASIALTLLCENTADKSLLEPSGLVEAAVYLMSHVSLAIVSQSAKTLATLCTDRKCADLMLSLRKQLGPALLDQVFQSDAVLVSCIAGVVAKLFGLLDKKSVISIAKEMIPDIGQEDLDDAVAIILKEVRGTVSSPMPTKKVVVAAAPSATVSDEDPHSDEEKLHFEENDEIFLDPEAQEELERELAGMDDFDDSMLSEQSQIEAEEMEAHGEDHRVVALLKLGAKLEDEANDLLAQELVNDAEEVLDQALAK
jgi:hypothetical protein